MGHRRVRPERDHSDQVGYPGGAPRSLLCSTSKQHWRHNRCCTQCDSPSFFVEPALTLEYTSINLVLIGQKRFPPCAWIQRTGCVLWNLSVKLEYVDTLPCEYFALALVGLDSVRLPRTTRKGEHDKFIDSKHANILMAV